MAKAMRKRLEKCRSCAGTVAIVAGAGVSVEI